MCNIRYDCDFHRMADFTNWPIIGKGSERICYLNPSNKTHLFKISPKSNAKQTLREINYFRFLIGRGIPFDHLPKFYGTINGDDFTGLVQEFIPVSENTIYSETLKTYLDNPLSLEQKKKVRNALEVLKAYLLRYNIIPSDLFHDNIAVKHTPSGISLYLIDGLGSTELIPVSNYLKALGNRKILRKWEKFTQKIATLYPQLDI